MIKIYSEKLLFWALGLFLFSYPLTYWGYYSGDAIIHLVFGQNAALGHLFEFNLNDKSSGESSVAYMLLLGLFFKVMPSWIVPIVVKVLNYLVWLSLLFVFYSILKLKQFNKYIIAASLFAVGLLPGSVYNSMNGMENGLFALYTLSWFYLSIQFSYFALNSSLSRNNLYTEIILSFFLGVGVWLRPEAMPLFVSAIGARIMAFIYYKQPIYPIMTRTLVGIAAFILPFAMLSFFIHTQTGMWIQSSVMARTFLGRVDASHFGLFIFDPKFLIRLIMYFPITFFWICGVVNFFQNHWQKNVDEFYAITLFVGFMILFVFISGAAQLGRYMIFLTPFWVLIAARGVQSTQKFFNSLSPRVYTLSSVAAILSLASIYGFETSERFKLGNDRDFIMTINSPQDMQKESDSLYEQMGHPQLPIIIAGGEVDERYRLDNRFFIRSLDGRIDAAFLKYFHQDSIDYIGYLKERGINYFMLDYSIPSFNNTLPADTLKKLKIGEHIDTEGLRITYIGTNYSIYKIDKIS